MAAPKASHWERYATTWEQVGAPLRPCPDDIRHFAGAVAALVPATQPGKALILGVTPEIAAMTWPARCHVMGLDRSAGMIHGVWPAHGQAQRAVVCGEWSRMPVSSRSFDVVLADGCFTQLPYPDGYRAVASEVRRVLHGQGLFLSRFFARTPDPEEPAGVHRRLAEGRVSNFHEFKFRLAMSLQRNAQEGVRVHDVWRHWSEARHDPAQLCRRFGWTPGAVDTIEAYRGSDAVYTFPSQDEILDAFEGLFDQESCVRPGYPFGDNCPILSLRPRP